MATPTVPGTRPIRQPRRQTERVVEGIPPCETVWQGVAGCLLGGPPEADLVSARMPLAVLRCPCFFEGKPVAGLVSAPLDVIAIVVLQVVWPC